MISLFCMQTIVQDDEYVSISSANLNQRSLDGSRDTELGMGSWQPAYTLANAQHSQDGGGTAAAASAYSDSAAQNQSGADAAATYGHTDRPAGGMLLLLLLTLVAQSGLPGKRC